MDVKTRKRAELKSYFVKNSIPTEGNFADLIDGMLNQKDDGIVKLPGNPLSIESAGDAAGTQGVLNLYRSITDPQPEWILSLNPRTSANDARSAHRGLNIAENNGKSRLFIEVGTGNAGLGTITPNSALSVMGAVSIGENYAQSRDSIPSPNGLMVEGSVGIGIKKSVPTSLAVAGNAAIGTNYSQNRSPANGLIVEGLVGLGIDQPASSIYDGLNGYAIAPAMNIDFRGGITIEAWVYYYSFRSWSRIIDFGNGAGRDNILFANPGLTNNLAVQVNPGGNVASPGALELNTWIHLAATVDSRGVATLYKNGTQIQILDSNGRTGAPSSTNRTINYIGKSNWINDSDFDGRIRDVRIWNTVRTAQQIADNRNQALVGSEPNLVANWPLGFNNLNDVGPNHFNLTLGGGAGWFDQALTVGGGVAINEELYVRRKIHNPMWKVTHVLDSAGGLPLTANFTTDGGLIVVFASGSGWGVGETQIGMQVLINDGVIGTLRSYSNERNSHKAFVSNSFVVGVGKGQQKLTLNPLPGTVSDGNDFYYVTVAEFPI